MKQIEYIICFCSSLSRRLSGRWRLECFGSVTVQTKMKTKSQKICHHSCNTNAYNIKNSYFQHSNIYEKIVLSITGEKLSETSVLVSSNIFMQIMVKLVEFTITCKWNTKKILKHEKSIDETLKIQNCNI